MTSSRASRVGVGLVMGACASMSQAADTSAIFSTYFNQRADVNFVEPYRGWSRAGDNFEQVVTSLIREARSSLDVAVMVVTLPHVAQALADVAQRGVRVRVIMDNSYRRDWSALTPDEVASLSAEDQELWAEVDTFVDADGDGEVTEAERASGDVAFILASAGIPVIDDTEDGSKGSGLMHHKFVVVDGRTVLTGSANWTHSGFFGDIGRPSSRGNAENLVVVRQEQVAQAYAQEFALMWGDGPGGQRDSRFGVRNGMRPAMTVNTPDGMVQLQFGPSSATKPSQDTTVGLIDATLKSATHRVDLGAFVITDASLTDTMGLWPQVG
ncbi:MAG: hypothetical protein EKK47_10000 [Burkholderiales bacterium]|jgi:phosphatidylserine/phosphatidylglycerophosphate/cardiolipin synthase-like enzyme|nr:MAG: hypothetical protein EKK47_10000 [Burkholderiales bacterium]